MVFIERTTYEERFNAEIAEGRREEQFLARPRLQVLASDEPKRRVFFFLILVLALRPSAPFFCS